MAVDRSAIAARRVGRLHVRARTRQDVQRAAVLIGDALNTASLPGAERERLVVIRRLALGRISVNRSAASVALQLEHAAREAATEAVSIESAAAGAANAVTFTNRAHALCALARTLSRGEQGDQWFWPMVVPGWKPTVGRGARWVHLMDAAHGGADAPVVAAAVLEEAMRADGGVELLRAVVPGKGAHWLRLEGWGHIASSEGVQAWRPASVRSAEVVHRWSKAWSRIDDRTTWLGTLLTCIERPASIGDASLAARVAAAMARMNAPVLAMRVADRATPTGRGQTTADALSNAGGTPDTHPRSSGDRAPHDALMPPVLADTRGTIDDASRYTGLPMNEVAEAPSADRHPHPQPGLNGDEGFFTHFAGIYFAVPVLERLQFAAFLASHPELVDSAFPAHLLWSIARRAGLPDTDPLARAFEEQCGAPVEMEAGPLVAWVTAVRRWCRRRARIGVGTLIRRPGRLHLSRTHVEASFPLSALDVRVRRSALDVDPGWVPWLGRVVQFRYGGHDDR